MPVAPVFPLQIFYDGSCSVCAAAMELYRRKGDAGDRLIFIDIGRPDFDPASYQIPLEQLEQLMCEMYSVDSRGRIYRGVDSVWAIWKAFPVPTLYGLLGALVTLPAFYLLACLGYRLLASTRKHLPKSREFCADRLCRLGRGNHLP